MRSSFLIYAFGRLQTTINKIYALPSFSLNVFSFVRVTVILHLQLESAYDFSIKTVQK